MSTFFEICKKHLQASSEIRQDISEWIFENPYLRTIRINPTHTWMVPRVVRIAELLGSNSKAFLLDFSYVNFFSIPPSPLLLSMTGWKGSFSIPLGVHLLHTWISKEDMLVLNLANLVPSRKSSEDKTSFLLIISSVYWIKSSGMSHMKGLSIIHSKWYLKILKIVWYFENEYLK